MNVRTAIQMMTTQVSLPGESDAALVQNVVTKQRASGASAPSPKSPIPAVGLDGGGISVRPIEALHRLARVTALTIESDVYALYEHWGWIRYLGAFGHISSPRQLSLDQGALQHVHANHRRVMSEELGIGFGVLLAEHWCRAMGATGSIRITDIDRALRDSRILSGLTQAPGALRQPDYLLQYASPTVPSAQESRLLETKGTVSRGNAIGQLAHAMTQLSSLVLDGSTLQGVAISTIATTRGISYLAVDPKEDSEPWHPEEDAIDRAKIRRPTVSDLNGVKHVSREELLSSAAVTANAALADFAGLNEVASRWLPEDEVLHTRSQRSIKHKLLDYGDYSGVEFSISAPEGDGVLRVFQGVERGVEEALRSGNDERVRAAQERFSRSLGDSGATAGYQQPSDSEATAVSDEGAILQVTVSG